MPKVTISFYGLKRGKKGPKMVLKSTKKSGCWMAEFHNWPKRTFFCLEISAKYVSH